ncbi:MAG: radical SAM protein [Acidobacteria bacterium]|nr:radical SAM protein [Acidobacteriota bacterium]
MSLRSQLYDVVAPPLRKFPKLKQAAIEADKRIELLRHAAADYFPQVIQPNTRSLTVAITAYCNLRCVGCRYGRDFMPNSQLPWELARDMFDDAKAAGVEYVRLYGGEPLLHPDLPKMVAHCVKIGLRVYVTTNGVLLKDKVDELYDAGLRDFTIGFYGVKDHYDNYVQRKDRFAQLEASLDYVREKYGIEIGLRMNWLLMRPSCSVTALHEAFQYVEKYNFPMRVDLVHYSLPYFTEGPEKMLQFRAEDLPAIKEVTKELVRLKLEKPALIDQSALSLTSIPDWLIKGEAMRVPCDKYQMLWIGADGTVQLCYVTFKLGNLHETRLRDMLFTSLHHQAARDAFAVNCPNCHCGYDSRVHKHLPSLRKYTAELVQISR